MTSQNVLNPVLYRLLLAKFGSVKIANQGSHALTRYMAGRNGRLTAQIKSGEYYRVNCPRCAPPDRHHHLWISHRFGEYDARSGRPITHAAICYRCGRGAEDLYLIDALSPSFSRFSVEPVVADVAAYAAPPPLPGVSAPVGVYARLTDLPSTHPAAAYLSRRGFDAAELDGVWGWRFCVQSPNRNVSGRLFIPVYADDGGPLRMVGWQTRAVPGVSVNLEPKYFTMPGFAKSRALYGFAYAKRCARIVITEGVTDAVRVGIGAVALFGKTMSFDQQALLAAACPNARVAVLLDSDAAGEGHALAARLNAGAFSANQCRSGAFFVFLEHGDPADLPREELIARIDAADHGLRQPYASVLAAVSGE